MNTTDFVNRIARAFHQLFRADAELFDLGTDGINEQTLTFRLGLYLACDFRDHNVDCEYNRLWDDTKKCVRFGIAWMKPDVIVHLRQSDKANLLCIEARKIKDWKVLKTIPEDIENKLKALTHPDEAYHYSLGLAWRIAPSPNPTNHEVIWFINGIPVLTTRLLNFEKALEEELAKSGFTALQR